MISFLLGSIIFVAVLCVLYWRWSIRIDSQIAAGAGVEWDRAREREPALVEGLDFEDFKGAYRRANFPRFPKYAIVAIAAFLFTLPATLGGLAALALLAERIGLIPTPVALARYVPVGEASSPAGEAHRQEIALHLAQNYSGFYLFFGVLGAWMVIVAVVMRRYHMRRPGFLHEEVIRAREAKLSKPKEAVYGVSAHDGPGGGS